MANSRMAYNAVGALAVAPILSVYASVYPDLVSRFGASNGLFLCLKAILAFASIVVPTMAMGGTLPILAEWLDSGKKHPGVLVGWLYMVNAAGAAVGALAFPFLLLPSLGVERTTDACAASNLIIALAAFWMALKQPRHLPPGVAAEIGGLEKSRPRLQPLWLAFISGAGTFALQVVWNRAFAQIHENTVFSFALIVSVFILAIAAGAELARLCLKARMSFQKALGGAWISGGILTVLSPLFFVCHFSLCRLSFLSVFFSLPESLYLSS